MAVRVAREQKSVVGTRVAACRSYLRFPARGSTRPVSVGVDEVQGYGSCVATGWKHCTMGPGTMDLVTGFTLMSSAPPSGPAAAAEKQRPAQSPGLRPAKQARGRVAGDWEELARSPPQPLAGASEGRGSPLLLSPGRDSTFKTWHRNIILQVRSSWQSPGRWW